MIDVISLLIFNHPLIFILALGSIILAIKTEGSYEFIVFLILLVMAFYHDKVVSTKK